MLHGLETACKQNADLSVLNLTAQILRNSTQLKDLDLSPGRFLCAHIIHLSYGVQSFTAIQENQGIWKSRNLGSLKRKHTK